MITLICAYAMFVGKVGRLQVLMQDMIRITLICANVHDIFNMKYNIFKLMSQAVTHAKEVEARHLHSEIDRISRVSVRMVKQVWQF